ncbi:MAG TPA: tripartite tricarboxylate transporter substrate-binding protein, partial [Acetobacteraceae bacterium]|nr:tripartite tricarboxylate transporter substrate-binding protein [Acetobacteraceae bacterium]
PASVGRNPGRTRRLAPLRVLRLERGRQFGAGGADRLRAERAQALRHRPIRLHTPVFATAAIHSQGDKGLAGAPEIPTATEAGLASFETEAWWALLGPRGLPETVTGPLERAALEAARDPAAAERLRAFGAQPVGSARAELAATLRTEDAKWGEATRAAGIAVE